MIEGWFMIEGWLRSDNCKLVPVGKAIVRVVVRRDLNRKFPTFIDRDRVMEAGESSLHALVRECTRRARRYLEKLRKVENS